VRRYASAALIKDGRRYAASATDRLYTRMAALSTGGLVDVDVRGSKVRTLIALHWNAVQQFSITGDASTLAPFKGKRAGGIELASDPRMVEEFWRQGDLDVDDIYA
jgi:hypothetical protein